MLSKNPLDIQPGRRLNKDEIAQALRLSIIAELDAINLYLQLASSVEDEKVKKVFEDIAREEKTHVGEFLAVLKQYDPAQIEELERGEKEVAELMGLNSGSGVRRDNGEDEGFESIITREVRGLVESSRLITKRVPVRKIGRGIDAVVFESPISGQQNIIRLREISRVFRVSQRSIDSALRFGHSIEVPDAVTKALELVRDEERTIVDTILETDGVNRLTLSSWDQPGSSIHDLVKAISEISRNGFIKPYLVLMSYSRYSKLLVVDGRTGVTDLERVRMMVDDIVVTHAVPDDRVIVLSNKPEVIEVVYGEDLAVDYLGPEDGDHLFRIWETFAIVIKQPKGIAILE